jgi:small subunit ribosomal protein S6
MVILDPDLEERTIAPSLDTFLNVIRNGGGTVEKTDVWGRRRLSFEIDKKTEGIYAVIDLTAEPATMKELDRQLNLNESILRTKVMRPELRASKPAPAKAPKPAAAPSARRLAGCCSLLPRLRLPGSGSGRSGSGQLARSGSAGPPHPHRPHHSFPAPPVRG